MKNRKRILAVKTIRSIDESPDTSHLGEFSNRPTSDFSIDRAHSEDCQSLEANHRQTVDKLERVITYLNSLRRSPDVADNPESTEWESLDEAIDLVINCQDESMDCDCSGGDMGRNEYRYFNPSFNYIKKDGSPADNLTPEDIRKYTREDYNRMESLSRGDWSFVGIRAEAEVISTVQESGSNWHGVIQTVSSGGLYGIESDAEDSYLESVERDELDNLKSELVALGFSRRAISKAFKSVERKDV